MTPPYRRTLSVAEAAAVLGIGRSLAYELIARDEFPVPVIRLGNLHRIPTVLLAELLAIDPEEFA